MNKILLSAALVLSLSSSLMAEKNTLPRTSDKNVEKKAEEQLKLQNNQIVKLAQEAISKTLPLQINKVTKFVSIKAEGLKLLHYYEIDVKNESDEDIRKNGKEKMGKYMIEGICKNSQRFLQGDIAIAYIYSSAKSKDELFRFDVTYKDCKSFW